MSASTEFSQRIMPHSRRMFAVAYRYMQQPEEAEDVLQDVMLKLWQIRLQLPPDPKLLPYLLSMVRNLCIDRLRARHTINNNMEISNIAELDIGDSPADIDDRVEEKDRLRHMLGLIAQLPPDQQEVLRLKAFDDLSTEEIAEKMNIKPETVRQHLSRGRKKLRELAQKQGLL